MPSARHGQVAKPDFVFLHSMYQNQFPSPLILTDIPCNKPRKVADGVRGICLRQCRVCEWAPLAPRRYEF